MNSLLKSPFSYVALAFSFMLAACTTDLYEPDKEPTPPNPGQTENLPKDFTWSLNNDTELIVNIDGLGEEKYIVEAYVGNPAIDANALLIAGSQQKVNNKIAYKRNITIPDGVQTLYLRVTDNRQRVSVYGFDVKKGTMVCTIGGSGVQTKSAAVDMRAMKAEIPEVDYSYAGKDYIVLTGNKKVDLQTGKVYLIPHGQTFSGAAELPGEGKASIYVEGTWQVTNNIQCETATFIYVLDGGKMEARSSRADISLIGTARIAIQKGGELGGDKHPFNELYLTDQTSLVNAGDMEVKVIKMDSNGSVYNTGDLETEDLITNNAGNHIVNMREFEAKHVSMTNGVIDNYCKFESDKLEVVANGVINVAPAGYMDVDHLIAQGLTLFMDAKSMWEGDKAQFKGQRSFVKGSATDYALFKVDNVDVQKNSGIVLEYSGMLNIDADHHTKNGNYNWEQWFTQTREVAFSEGQGFVEIDESDCNGNSGNHNPGTDPVDPDGDITEQNTLPYTYLFEDNWPQKGDYDMNDIVMSVELRNTTSADGKVKVVDIYAKLYAVGAAKKLAVAFQLDGIPQGAVGEAEPNQQYAVVRLFDDAHAELGSTPGAAVNTFTYDKGRIKEIHKHIEFATPLDKGISFGNFNLFIVWGDMEASPRNEIHIPGFRGTNKAAKNPASSDTYISTSDGWMWGLAIPLTDFGSFPKESVYISEAYTGFEAWTKGAGTPAWYLNPVEGKTIITVDVPEEEPEVTE